MLGDIREHAWLNDLTVRLILAVVVTISCATYHYVELSAQGGQAVVAAQSGGARGLTLHLERQRIRC